VRREYKGAAQASTLTAQLGNSTSNLTIYCNDLTNWPTGTVGPFFVVVNRGQSNEEKILCVTRAGNVLTVYNSGGVNGRAYDGTSITTHAINSSIEHVFAALDADEANAHVNTSGLHVNSGQTVITVCTSATRPASPAANQVILETDTQNLYSYISGSWTAISSNTGTSYSDIMLLGGM
jgi:hypothetical protein